ncbi:MAG: large conductance mechanosensitive channel protein MscL [Bryobacteraceae bacterium]|jgi:large conductance mechanosensitive channel
MTKGFKEFLLKNNVLALAVAVIVGGAVGKVVSSLAADIIMPLIGPAIPGGNWRTATIEFGKRIGADGKEVVNTINIGTFFGSVVDFLIIAIVVYLITKALFKQAPAPPPPPSKTCPRCKEAVALDATRCKFCTSDL